MIPLLIYNNCSFHDLFLFLNFLMSRPLAYPYNVTHLSIKFIMFNHYSRKIINAIKTWLPFSSWNQYQYPFVGTCILVCWFRSWMLDPIMFPTNQPIRGEFFALNCFFLSKFIEQQLICFSLFWLCYEQFKFINISYPR
jgi:hypothetical protein